MAKIKTECPICGTVTKTAAAPTMCARCGADLTRPGVEAVVYTARCNCVPNGQRAMRAGNLFVTNYRFFWLENATTGIGAMGGLVGVLVESAVKSMQMPGMAFCLALNDIGELTDARFGVRKTLQVTAQLGRCGWFRSRPCPW
jgi:hypothetical protein